MTRRVSVFLGVLGFCAILPIGCLRDASVQDAEERREPLMQKAAAKAGQGDVAGAIAIYGRVIEESPRLARAHLDLALLLHDDGNDYVGAVYHYRRYLELRPGTEKKEMIGNRIRLARQLLAASVLGHDRKQVQTMRAELERLREENIELKQRLEACE